MCVREREKERERVGEQGRERESDEGSCCESRDRGRVVLIYWKLLKDGDRSKERRKLMS